MKILAIDTATPASSVALGREGRLEALAVQVDRRGHVGFLGEALDFCFARAGWRPTDLDAVAVDVGPGLFTGIRAGLATAQGVAASVGVPIVPATSLDALAFRAATGHRHIWSVVDARKGEVAVAPYRPVPGGVVKDGTSELMTPEEFRATLDSDREDVLVVGDWQALPPGWQRGLHRVKTGRPRYPSADVLLEITELQARRDDLSSSPEVRPIYLRQPDAAISWTRFRTEGIWPEG